MMFYFIIPAIALFHLLVLARFLDWGTNLVVFLANSYYVVYAKIYFSTFSRNRFNLYVLGYFVLFLLLFSINSSPLLFSLFLFLYASLFRLPRILGYLLILLFSLVVLPIFWIEASVVLSIFYTAVIFTFPKMRNKFLKMCFIMGFVFLSGMIFPLVYLLMQSSPQTLFVSLGERSFQTALFNSFLTSTVTAVSVLLFGVPLSYAMSRTEFPGKKTVDTLIDLPILIPQTIVGVVLLGFLGPKTPIGEFLHRTLGVDIGGSYIGIILCQIFVSFPFLVRSAMNAFDNEELKKMENVSRTLGAGNFSTFCRISLPLCSSEIFNGTILTWARAISEAGSLMVLAYYPFTIPIYTYDVFTQFGLEETQPFAILLVITCLWVFVVLRYLRDNARRIWRILG